MCNWAPLGPSINRAGSCPAIIACSRMIAVEICRPSCTRPYMIVYDEPGPPEFYMGHLQAPGCASIAINRFDYVRLSDRTVALLYGSPATGTDVSALNYVTAMYFVDHLLYGQGRDYDGRWYEFQLNLSERISAETCLKFISNCKKILYIQLTLFTIQTHGV